MDQNILNKIDEGTELLKNKDSVKALRCFEYVLEHKPDNAASLTGRGLALSELGDYEDALKSFERLIELFPGRADGHYFKAQMLLLLNRHSQALETVEHAISLNSHHALFWLLKSEVLMKKGGYEEAAEAAACACKLDPGLQPALICQGRAFLMLNRPSAAADAYEKALLIDQHTPAALSGKALAMLELKQYDEALMHLNMLLKIDPSHQQGWEMKIKLLGILGGKQQAAKAKNEAEMHGVYID